ncbi:MAG: hypothetical protein LBG72_09080 [Spirochaetaceae bacterium]|jgi:hypothetical protein|nr:hypothetical protein [Spirochaetaceae bacterium]
MKRKKYQSKILMVIHQDMEAAYHLGLLTDEEMREFDEDCLVHEPEEADSAVPAHAPSGGAKSRSRKRAAKAVADAVSAGN